MIVYTVITNDYDDLKPVRQTDENSYVCFTDDLHIKDNGWYLLKADKPNRWYKFHSNELFPSSKHTIYIDANASLNKSPQDIVKELGDYSIGIQPHSQRDCIYEEADECIELQVEDAITARKAMDYYKSKGYPEHNGLYANSCIVRKNDEVSTMWNAYVWKWFNDLELKRDQLVTQFVTWSLKVNIQPIEMMERGRHK